MRKFFTDIKEEVCKKHGITKEQFDGHDRNNKFVNARQEAWWRAKQETDLSYTIIGMRSGGKHHTTILNGVRRYAIRHHLAIPGSSTQELLEGSSES
jgi:chromosomal replication initiation ATPase DnaA